MGPQGRAARLLVSPLTSRTTTFGNTGLRQLRCLSHTCRPVRPQRSLALKTPAVRLLSPQYARLASNATATAPSAKNYIESGVIAGAQDLVDVKKVLVIGSGGLSIGQAGEFDYSGMAILSMPLGRLRAPLWHARGRP